MVRLDIRLTFTSGGYADECEGLELEDADAFASGSFFAADFMDFCVPGEARRCLRNGCGGRIRRAMASGAGGTQPDDVEAELKAIRQAELDAMRDEWRAKLYSGEISVWSLFEDYAMLGDSRTSGFTYYGYLAPERVFADSGATIKKVIDHLEELVALNPSIIFLTYGINDVGIGYWPTPEDYVNEINNTLALLKEHLPNATVYVCSIIPALEPAFKRGPAWREIPDYNDAVRAFCEENGTPYVDITQLCEEHTDLYQDDGVHLLGGFYPLWGTELIAEVYDDVFALESNESAAE